MERKLVFGLFGRSESARAARDVRKVNIANREGSQRGINLRLK